MVVVPDEAQKRLHEYCTAHGRVPGEMIGYGVEGFVWRTDSLDTEAVSISVVKVFRRETEFRLELAVYRKLAEKRLDRLQGFAIPALLGDDTRLLILEMSFVFPPFVLDFGAATLDAPPRGFHPDDPAWQAEKQRLYGNDWPDVKRLLDALRQYGIHYSDVHLGNIRVRP